MDEDRIAAALVIIMEPWKYKVCEGCDSILTETTVICPSCKSYRFDYKELSVTKMAKELANNKQKTVTESDLF
jgi:hypothetical protein